MKLSNLVLLALLGLLVLLNTPVTVASSDGDGAAPEPMLDDGEEYESLDEEKTEVSVTEEELALEKPEDVQFVEPDSFPSAFVETFQTDPFKTKRWLRSTNSKYARQMVSVTEYPQAPLKGDKAMLLRDDAKHYGVAAVLPQPLQPGEDGDTVLQYEVHLTRGLGCGGAYLKFLTQPKEGEPPLKANGLHDQSAYTIMFGPDKCGENNKVHFILRHQNPVSGEWEEKHAANPPGIANDMEPHVYTLILRAADQTFEILIDGASKLKGSLLEDLSPPVNPPHQIDDPDDFKPEDWVDEAQILDPEASKPDDWDEEAPKEIPDADAEKPYGWLDDAPAEIPDPEAQMPEDWDEEEDGDWEAPLVSNPDCDTGPGCGEWVRPMMQNPDYKGKWEHPLIDNPLYKGVWAPRKIDNPHFFTEDKPSSLGGGAIGGVGLEVWTMEGGITLDNIYVGSSTAEAQTLREQTFDVKRAARRAVLQYEKRKDVLTTRLKSLKAGGLGGTLEYYSGTALDFIADNLLLSSVTGVGAVAMLFYFCMRGDTHEEPEYVEGGAEDEDEEEEEDADDADSDSDADDKAEEVTTAAATAAPSEGGLRQRKARTPKST